MSIFKGPSKEKLIGKIVYEEHSSRYGLIIDIHSDADGTEIEIIFLYDAHKDTYIERIEVVNLDEYKREIELGEEKLRKICELYDFLKNYPIRNLS